MKEMSYSVLITGGSRGIGKATCELFRSKGYNVTAPNRDELELSDKESVKKYIESHPEGFDIIINNAGINEIHEVGELDEMDLEKMMFINLISPYMLITASVILMALTFEATS